MATPYNNSFDNCKPFSDHAPSFNLAANTPLSYTLPGDDTNRYRVEFHWTAAANVYVAINSTAAAPGAGTISSSSVSTFRPDVRYARGGDVLSFVSPDASTYGGFSLLQLPN